MFNLSEKLKEIEVTKSLCPVCLEPLPAKLVTNGSSVYVDKVCAVHGRFLALISSEAERYLASSKLVHKTTPYASPATEVRKGCPLDCGLCPEHKQHTCLAIFEITGNCNLCCPTCLASSQAKGGFMVKMDEFKDALISLLAHEGRATPLQLSGGEPTIHPDLVDFIAEARRLSFKYVEVNTNGIALAKRPELAKISAEAGLNGIYLQFDGVTDDVYRRLRGADLFRIKEEAIYNAKKAGLNVVLAVTAVKGVNDHQLWEIVRYGLKMGVNGVNFQPFAMQGRYPKTQLNPLKRITNYDVAHLIEEQSSGLIKTDDFLPIPCADPRCQIMAYLTVGKKSVLPLSRLIDKQDIQEYYRSFTDSAQMTTALKELRKTLNDLCGCSSTPDVCCIPTPEPNARFFALSSHAMMDVWNADVHRLERCCIHELTPEGKLIPFCLYNYTSTEGVSLYRNSANELSH